MLTALRVGRRPTLWDAPRPLSPARLPPSKPLYCHRPPPLHTRVAAGVSQSLPFPELVSPIMQY